MMLFDDGVNDHYVVGVGLGHGGKFDLFFFFTDTS
jgi:hypothetical protein